ncbi:MAG: glutamine synthetase III [Clostridia bacterium]
MKKHVNAHEIFGENVFSENVMKEKLPRNIYQQLKETIKSDKQLEPHIADVIATVMKDWAMEKGATHYCHWFQPMTGLTAQKNDAFLNPTDEGVMAQFSGKELIKGESDASSFPSGGIRSTFEARGYTAWDCTSPAFIKDGVLCIPTAFCSYYGDALDKKTPLLRSMEVLEKETIRLMKLIGFENVKSVTPNVGAEQEYFLMDKDLFRKRADLIYTGRTLFGALPPKGQEMDDHYFATIKERVKKFMREVNIELWKLGVAVKTEHNEVGLGQFELAPIFNTTNVATDQNQLIMDTLRKIANRHDLECLLHEKPFAGINGSGKHVNWSLCIDGENILEPGDNPEENLRFLLVMTAIVKAVDEFPELLRVAASTPGNDQRLGAAEAPPGIISIFLGEYLTSILESIGNDSKREPYTNGHLKLGVTTLPLFMNDATDRNRTSPFAFTANKFEFRMVASSMSIADPCTVINTIVADAFYQISNELEGNSDVIETTTKLIKKIYNNHKRVVYNGDGYSEEWKKEAENRGLPNIGSFIESVPYLISDKSIDLFTRNNVLSETELHARYEILVENYYKLMKIEALTMVEMVDRYLVPNINIFLKEYIEISNITKKYNNQNLADIDSKNIQLIIDQLYEARFYSDKLEDMVKVIIKNKTTYETALSMRKEVVPIMDKLRNAVDILEKKVSKDAWPWPGYDDIFFSLI